MVAIEAMKPDQAVDQLAAELAVERIDLCEARFWWL
jgi:hypothetical protein